MPSLVSPIATDGPIVEVEVSWSSAEIRVARRTGRPIPAPIQCRALIDTGADGSCLDSTLIRQLGLPFGGISMVNVPVLGGLVFSPSHDANLIVRHPSGNSALDLVFADVLVLDLDLGMVACQCFWAATCLLIADFSTMGQQGDSNCAIEICGQVGSIDKQESLICRRPASKTSLCWDRSSS